MRLLGGALIALAGALVLAPSCSPQALLVGPVTASPSLATPPAPTAGTPVIPAPGTLVPIPDGYRIKIPRLGIDLPIAEGSVQRDIEQQRTPEGLAFHLPGTSIPGAAGNTYVYSHARVGMFLSLWDARIGDDVIVVTPEGRTLRYAVSEVRPRVAPSDVSVARATADERLTLQTSTGPAPDDPRFVVIAFPR